MHKIMNRLRKILIILVVIAFQSGEVFSKRASNSDYNDAAGRQNRGKYLFERTETNKYKDNDSSMKWIDRRCPRYISAENGVCKDVLGNRRIMKTKNLQKVAEEKLSKSIEQLELLMTLVESNTIGEILYFANVSGVSLSKKFVVVLKELKQHPEEMKECLKQGRWMYCNIYFPTCEARNGFIRQIPICKDICVKIEADICAKSIQLLELVNYEGNFDKPNCSLYPDRSLNHKDSCISFNKTESKGNQTKTRLLSISTSYHAARTSSRTTVIATTAAKSSTNAYSSTRIRKKTHLVASTFSLVPTASAERTQQNDLATKISHFVTSGSSGLRTLTLTSIYGLSSIVRSTKIVTDTSLRSYKSVSLISTTASAELDTKNHDHGKGSLARRNKIIIIAVVTSAVSFFIILVIVAVCTRRTVCRKNENHDVMDDVGDEETPYYATNLDSAEAIRRIMTAVLEDDKESNEDESLEMEDEKPFINDSYRPEIDCIL